MTSPEYYALKMLILVALNSKECKNDAVWNPVRKITSFAPAEFNRCRN